MSFYLPPRAFGSYNIDVHDYTVRLKAAKKFLADGDKVAVILFHDTNKCNGVLQNHLFMTNAESSISFLQVKIIVSLKGRENEFRNNAIELIRRFQSDVGEVQSITLENSEYDVAYLAMNDHSLLSHIEVCLSSRI